MSTVVYHGFRLSKGWDSPRGLQSRLSRFQTAVRKEALRRAQVAVAETAVMNLDRTALGFNDKVSATPWTDAAVEVHMAMAEARKRPDAPDSMNLECSVVLYPTPGGWLARICPNGHQDYVDLFEVLPGVTPYSVDTRTDPPKGIPPRTYRAMVRRWETADSKAKMVFECLGNYGWPLPSPESCYVYHPTMAYRVRNLALDTLLAAYLKEHTEDSPMTAYWNGLRYFKDTPEGKARLEATEAEYRARLPESYPPP